MKYLYELLEVYEFFYTLFFHRRIIRRMEEELAKPFEVRLQEMRSHYGQIELTVESPVIGVWCDAFANLLASYPGAENYLTFDFHDQEGQMWNVLLQRKDGKSPIDFLIDKNAELARLRQENEALKTLIGEEETEEFAGLTNIVKQAKTQQNVRTKRG